jgi:pimeloyl-ACP methyl ester carboxylesterase
MPETYHSQETRVLSSTMNVALRGRDIRLSYFDRPGDQGAIFYVHGLGCSKADFLEMTEDPCLHSCRLIAYDHPGCGDSPYDPAHPLNIDDLAELVHSFTTALGLSNFLLVGGSMGGLVALLYAERHVSKITGFVNVEGNLAPEDCMFSRQTAAHDYSQFENEIFPKIKGGLAAPHTTVGTKRHLQVLQRAVPHAYHDYSPQIVHYSDHGNLLERFVSLPVPRYFVYGSENRHLSYIPQLRQLDCEVIEIPNANHFLFYDNPSAFAALLAGIASGNRK